MDFLSGLAAIIIIDLVLAGDNAVVIALAARSLPKAVQHRAIVWGTVGAVVVRASLTAAMVLLLRIPGLMAAGGVLLTWIAYRLLATEDAGDGPHVASAMGFWPAMRTIVVADAVMGLDNVLGVAGAAHGNVLLVMLGLGISIPIVVWGSTLILGYLERFPALQYIGGAVLAWTAAQMITGEPWLETLFEEQRGLEAALDTAIVGGVLAFAWLHNRRRRRLRLGRLNQV